MNKNFNEKIFDGINAISIALKSPETLNILASFNFTDKKLNEGLNLGNKIYQLIAIQKEKYGKSFAATESFNKLFASAKDEYTKIFKIAKIAFRDNLGAQISLVLNPVRKRSFYQWLEQAKPFYGNLLKNENYLNAMSIYGYTAEKIQIGLDLLNKCESFSHDLQRIRAKAMAATKERNDELKKFETWISDFKTICKISLGKSSKNYKSLGF